RQTAGKLPGCASDGGVGRGRGDEADHSGAERDALQQPFRGVHRDSLRPRRFFDDGVRGRSAARRFGPGPIALAWNVSRVENRGMWNTTSRSNQDTAVLADLEMRTTP